MAVNPIPWMIQGGIHSAALGRQVAYQATGGAEGIASLGDLHVTQTSVASGAVEVAAGGAIMVSRYPGVKGESYMGFNPEPSTVDIDPNGSGSTRYDLIIARVDDWNMPGGQAVPETLPTDEAPAFKLAVIKGVAAGTKTAKQLDLNYPAIALARVAIPAGQSSVTDAMIADLREVAVPRRKRVVIAQSITGGTTDELDISGEYWPNLNTTTIDVPEWAVQAKINATWYGIKVPAGSTRTGSLLVRLAAGTASVRDTQNTGFDMNGVANQSRWTLGIADTLPVAAAIRGQSVNIASVGLMSGGAGGYLAADGLSSVVIDVEFVEAPAEDV